MGIGHIHNSRVLIYIRAQAQLSSAQLSSAQLSSVQLRLSSAQLSSAQLRLSSAQLRLRLSSAQLRLSSAQLRLRLSSAQLRLSSAQAQLSSAQFSSARFPFLTCPAWGTKNKFWRGRLSIPTREGFLSPQHVGGKPILSPTREANR